jgi:hypothetical protein
MESLLVEEEVLSRETGITSEKRYNFWSDRWIVLKQLLWFLEARFLVLPIEALLLEEEVLWRQTGITAEKGYNFWSDCWIALKDLQ